ncbi:MAG: GNAT family N-acetyltransferase [Oscillospiraceae bacterium]|nr:GNAT family N-acetyltransferase [Oscillospiraceae bacterium]
MIFYKDDEILVRNMTEADAGTLAAGEIAQGWGDTMEKHRTRLRDQAAGRCIALAAEYCGQTAGYLSVYRQVEHGPFAGKELPELVDFGVLEKFRRRGIGGKLMDAAEKLAEEISPVVGVGVGLHSGYGSAQRMYVKRGYVPDGSGVWYRDEVCPPYGACCNDDDLVLYLTKKLR